MVEAGPNDTALRLFGDTSAWLSAGKISPRANGEGPTLLKNDMDSVSSPIYNKHMEAITSKE